MSTSILDKPQFRILRRLSADQLQGINVWKARRRQSTHCPLAQATGTLGGVHNIASFLACPLEEADRFMRWFDHGGDRKQLTLAKRAAIAEARVLRPLP